MSLKAVRRLAGLALAPLLVASGCRDITGLPLPSGAIATATIPAEYRGWWNEVIACAGRYRPFATIRWYHVPNATYFLYEGGTYDGYWLSHPDRIIIAAAYTANAGVVRHEMLHALLQDGSHPSEYFERRCGALVRRTHDRPIRGAGERTLQLP